MIENPYHSFTIHSAREEVYNYLIKEIDQHVNISNFIIGSNHTGRKYKNWNDAPVYEQYISKEKYDKKFVPPEDNTIFKYFLTDEKNIKYYKQFIYDNETLKIECYMKRIREHIDLVLDYIFESSYREELKKDFNLNSIPKESFSEIYFKNKILKLTKDTVYCECKTSHNLNLCCPNVINSYN